jgi:hypothetical protein
MTPWQRAKQWHDEHITDETLEQTLGWHLSNGVLHASPILFMLAREVFWDADKEEMRDDCRPNAWFVELAAGAGCTNPVRECMRVVPHPHQYALWCRHNQSKIRAFDWRKLARKVGL